MAVRLNMEPLGDAARKFIGTDSAHLHRPPHCQGRKSRWSKLSFNKNPDIRAIWTGS